MISEEKLINRLRKRKTKLFALIFMIVVTFVPLIYSGIVLRRITVQIFTSDFEHVLEYGLLVGVAYLIAPTFLFCAMLGFLIGHLIVELGGWSKDRLLISMWDKIQRQEEELGRLSKMLGGFSDSK